MWYTYESAFPAPRSAACVPHCARKKCIVVTELNAEGFSFRALHVRWGSTPLDCQQLAVSRQPLVVFRRRLAGKRRRLTFHNKTKTKGPICRTPCVQAAVSAGAPLPLRIPVPTPAA